MADSGGVEGVDYCGVSRDSVGGVYLRYISTGSKLRITYVRSLE
jgi:hypothetical protein